MTAPISFLRAFLIAAAVGLAQCTPTPAVGPAAAAAQGPPPGEYRLGPGDKLRIVVFGHKDISGEVVIDGTGNIAMPLLGQIRARGLTVTELQESLRETLNRDYIVDPKVSIEVLNYRPFFILGEVNKPGSYPYVSGIDVLQAVALGGGFTRRARTSSVTIIRDTEEGRTTMRGTPDTPVLPGDTIRVGRRLF